MLKKRNLLFLSLLIMSVFLLSSCFSNPPATEGIIKGQVMVPEGTIQAKDLTGQALPDATVHIIDLETGAIIATATTDANGYYQISVDAGGPYLLEAVKDEVKVQQITPPVEVGIEYDLGTADCTTTAVALIVQAMLDAEDYPNNPADINLADIETEPNFDDVSSIVCDTTQDGGDPTVSALVQQAVEDFLYPPAPAPAPTTTPAPAPTYTVTFNKNGGDTEANPKTKTATHGGNVDALPATEPTKEGYTFASWNTQIDGNGTGFTAATAVIADITVYAQWTINTYTVIYNGNNNTGGTVPEDSSSPYEYGETVTVLNNAGNLVKTGYTFFGWNTQVDGNGINRTVGSIFDIGPSDVTLFAKWTANDYIITFNEDDAGATGDMAAQTIASGSSENLTPCAFTKTGWTFAGWATTSGGTVSYADEASYTMGTSNVTLYAQWTIWMGSVHNITKGIYYTTIQAALTAAVSDDIIEVADGTYNESIIFPDGEMITLRSVNDSSSTTITGDDGSATVTCSNSPNGTTLEGFKIMHNSGETGSGIDISAGYLTINSSTISGNSATEYGGGIYNGGTLTITDSTISDNSANHSGGGIYNYGTLTITDSTISGNSAAAGSGIYNISATLTITGSTISDNTADNYGGGIYNYDSTLTITGSMISDNTADIYGGGIYNYGTLTITGSTISDNTADNYGGGIYNYGTLTITGSTISGNSAAAGSGIYNIYATLTITGSTISDNTADNYGGGIYNYDSTLTITGSTISGNSATTEGGGISISSGTITIGGLGVENTICGNTTGGIATVVNQVNPNSYPDNYISVSCTVAIGDSYGGGIVAYVDGTGQHGLIAATEDQSAGIAWITGGSTQTTWVNGVDNSGTSTDYGTGQANTVAMKNQTGYSGGAAQVCDGYTNTETGTGIYFDWFLPSKDELNLMYTNLYLEGFGGFTTGNHWNSSESKSGAHYAWYQIFFNGGQGTNGKYSTYRVRPVRYF